MHTKIPQHHFLEPDILLVHKPVGISSFHLVHKLKKVLGTKKVGHAGTLDPLAYGLMIVGFDKGTKKLDRYLKLSKTYIADILIGRSTTTGDLEGETVEEKKPVHIKEIRENLEAIIEGLLGTHTLPVPLYSAIKVSGQPLYAYARAGKEPPFIPEKEMTIHRITLLDHYSKNRSGYYLVTVRLEVSSGSYIRTLAELLGQRLGYPATLSRLYRVYIAEYRDNDAYRLDPKKPAKKENIFRAIMRLLFAKSS